MVTQKALSLNPIMHINIFRQIMFYFCLVLVALNEKVFLYSILSEKWYTNRYEKSILITKGANHD